MRIVPSYDEVANVSLQWGLYLTQKIVSACPDYKTYERDGRENGTCTALPFELFGIQVIDAHRSVLEDAEESGGGGEDVEEMEGRAVKTEELLGGRLTHVPDSEDASMGVSSDE
jgi:hypothetical protein